MRLLNLYIYTTVLFIGLNLTCFASLDYEENTKTLKASPSNSRSVDNDTFNQKVDELKRDGKKIKVVNLMGQSLINADIIDKLNTLPDLTLINVMNTKIKREDIVRLNLYNTNKTGVIYN